MKNVAACYLKCSQSYTDPDRLSFMYAALGHKENPILQERHKYTRKRAAYAARSTSSSDFDQFFAGAAATTRFDSIASAACLAVFVMCS